MWPCLHRVYSRAEVQRSSPRGRSSRQKTCAHTVHSSGNGSSARCAGTVCVQASLASLRAEWSAELAALKTDVEHKRRMAAATLKARQEDEDIKV